MAGILGSMSEMLTPETVGKLGKSLGVDPEILNTGMAVAGPALLGSLAKKTSTPEGANGFMDLLTNAESSAAEYAKQGAGSELSGMLGLGGGAGDMINGLMGVMGASGGTGADMMQGLMGDGVNAISGTLSQKLGFDVKPMLTMAVPMVLSFVNKAKQSGNLDANGLADMLQTESKAYAADPANRDTVALLDEAYAAGDKASALRAQFTNDEWMKIRMAPLGALYLVAKASPSQGRAAMKELEAAAAAVSSAIQGAAPTSLVGTAFGGGLTAGEFDVLQKDAPDDAKVLAMLAEAKGLVAAKGGTGDAATYREMVIRVAENVASAAKEGGFLGIGGKLVSPAEEAAIGAIRGSLN